MANYKQLKRLERIVHFFTLQEYVSKREIVDKLQEDLENQISERSVERDLKALKEDFSLDINYSHAHHGYKLEDDERLLSRFFKFAELSSLADVYEQGLKNYKQFEKWIIPDDSSNLKGARHFNAILKALNHKLKLTFTTENFYTQHSKTYTVTPLRLKEYLNRWYLIAVKDGEEDIKNFGIERIQKLEILKESGVKVRDLDRKLARYDDIVGINYSDDYADRLMNITCRTYDSQHKYLETLPLHHSQKITYLPDTSKAEIHFHLQPNHEFIALLLQMHGNVEVIAPAEFRELMKGKLARMVGRYERDVEPK